MKNKPIETGLAVGDAKFGNFLLELAQEKNRESLQDTAVNSVRELLDKLQKQRNYLTQTEENIVFLQKKISAIQVGEFSFTDRGVLVLNDKQLNREHVGIGECSNCGYNNNKGKPPQY